MQLGFSVLTFGPLLISRRCDMANGASLNPFTVIGDT
jgi:hypothetical protein